MIIIMHFLWKNAITPYSISMLPNTAIHFFFYKNNKNIHAYWDNSITLAKKKA